MKRFICPDKGLSSFLLLWGTQSCSAFGSSMTSFALTVWSYQQHGSALSTALLAVCSYAPYVLMSLFAGALSDRWDKRRTMLACDSFAALTTCAALLLLGSGRLAVWHLYVLNALNGLMNALQQPASDVAVSLLAPREAYQKVGGLRAFSNSLVTLLTPAAATALLTLAGLEAVMVFDLATFAVAFLTLAAAIRIPPLRTEAGSESPLRAVGQGLEWLRRNRGILDLILFLAAINLVASVYNAALPAMLLSRSGGGQTALGLVETCTGAANLLGSLAAALLPAPRSRVKAICGSLFFAMSTENLILALGRSVPVWCAGAVLGWLMIPVMNTNLDALMRTHIPIDLQGRVYSVRNAFQFFTIPIGYLLGGVLVDWVLEPLMAGLEADSLLAVLFGTGKGTGAAVLFAVLAVAGVLVCAVFSRDRHIWSLEED